MSRVVAVAGGTGGIGRHVMDGLINHNKYKILLLSRNEQPDFTKQGIDVKIVDYNSIDSLKSVLKGVDTVISCVFSTTDYVESQTKLINASIEAGVKRFIPSEWALDIEKFPNALAVLYQGKIDLRKVLEKTSLEYTYVCNGLFMDYFLPKGAKKHLKDVGLPVDVSTATADIPGTGNEPVTYTLGDDIGKAVAVLLEQPKWEKYTFIHGDTKTFNEIVALGEKITGKKFTVTYQPKEELEKKIATLEGFPRFYAEVYMEYANAHGVLSKKENFPGVKFTTVAELLQQTYGK